MSNTRKEAAIEASIDAVIASERTKYPMLRFKAEGYARAAIEAYEAALRDSVPAEQVERAAIALSMADDERPLPKGVAMNEFYRGLARAALSATPPTDTELVKELVEALKTLSGLEVKGHALLDRLQFSTASRAIRDQVQQAITKAERHLAAQ